MDHPADILPPDVLASMLMRMFEFAPIAMSITTSDAETSSYAKVNDAYLRLTGLKWEDIRGRRLTSDGAAIASPARDRRHRMLEQEGCYVLEEVDLLHVDGTLIPTLISCQRTMINDASFDVEVIVDVSARVKLQRDMEQALKTSARTDALTGLPNRAWLDEFLGSRLPQAALGETHAGTPTGALGKTIPGSLTGALGAVPTGSNVALAFIDLNGFKQINDAMGHATGDDALRVVARRLRENCRPTDFVARIGGDEFAILFDAMPRDARKVENRLRRLMDDVFQPMLVDDVPVRLGAAVGVAFQKPGQDSPAALLRRADQLMYAAKSSGERVKVIAAA